MLKKSWQRNKSIEKGQELEDFNEVEIDLVEKVDGMIIHLMIKTN